MKQTVTLWGIERSHPRSTSLDSNVFGRTRKEVLELHLRSYVDVWKNTSTPDAGWDLWHRNRDAGMFRAVRVEVSWEPSATPERGGGA